MKHRRNIEISPKLLFIIFSLLCVGLLTVSTVFEKSVKPLNAVAGVIIVPMQKGINSIGTWVTTKLDTFQNIKELQLENKELKSKLDSAELENQNLEQEKYELERLKELYKLDKKYSDYPKVAARVIGKDAGNWFNVFLIDKGSKDGLKVNMNVLAGNGLVGIITEVGPNFARVKSIIDDTSSVSAMVQRTSDICIVDGNLKQIEDGYIDVTDIGNEAKIKEGDELVTSHISSKYLPGIPIGRISNIKMEPSNLQKTAKVAPVVDFKHLQEVLVITELKQKVK